MYSSFRIDLECISYSQARLFDVPRERQRGEGWQALMAATEQTPRNGMELLALRGLIRALVQSLWLSDSAVDA